VRARARGVELQQVRGRQAEKLSARWTAETRQLRRGALLSCRQQSPVIKAGLERALMPPDKGTTIRCEMKPVSFLPVINKKYAGVGLTCGVNSPEAANEH
jgi:hypothetical protein